MTSQYARGIKYADFRLSEALSSANVLALEAATLSGATLAGSNVTIGGQTIEAHQLRDTVRSFNVASTYSERPLHTIADDAEKVEQTRIQFEAAGSFLVKETADSSYDVILKDASGHRLLYIDTETGKKTVAVVQMFGVDETIGDDGSKLVAVTFKNSAGTPGRS